MTSHENLASFDAILDPEAAKEKNEILWRAFNPVWFDSSISWNLSLLQGIPLFWWLTTLKSEIDCSRFSIIEGFSTILESTIARFCCSKGTGHFFEPFKRIFILNNFQRFMTMTEQHAKQKCGDVFQELLKEAYTTYMILKESQGKQ